MHVLNTLAPVFLIIALGAVLGWRGFISDSLRAGLTRMCYWVGLPCLLFVKISQAKSIDAAAWEIAIIILIGTAVMIAVSLLAARLMHCHAARVGTFVQAGFRGNLAYVGLAIIVLLFPPEFVASTALAMAPVVVVYNVAAVVALLVSEHRLSAAAIKKIALSVITNPLLISCTAGIVWMFARMHFGLKMPVFIGRTLTNIGQFALPLALMCVGGSLASTSLKGHFSLAIVASVIKVALGPLLGYAAARLLGIGQTETAIAMIMLACPTAVASYILTEQLNGDTSLAAGSIVISTILSAVALSVVIATMT